MILSGESAWDSPCADVSAFDADDGRLKPREEAREGEERDKQPGGELRAGVRGEERERGEGVGEDQAGEFAAGEGEVFACAACAVLLLFVRVDVERFGVVETRVAVRVGILLVVVSVRGGVVRGGSGSGRRVVVVLVLVLVLVVASSEDAAVPFPAFLAELRGVGKVASPLAFALARGCVAVVSGRGPLEAGCRLDGDEQRGRAWVGHPRHGQVGGKRTGTQWQRRARGSSRVQQCRRRLDQQAWHSPVSGAMRRRRRRSVQRMTMDRSRAGPHTHTRTVHRFPKPAWPHRRVPRMRPSLDSQA